ncbi:MAG: hypothetical protein IPM47_07080 [Sphingobacteriales bacterium]|nr:MAG: hypothetical protein IPM47_07080 [Sphingobacteriales bacterium]
MPYHDIDALFSPAEITAANGHFAGLNTILLGKVVNLTPDERGRFYKMHNKRYMLAVRCLDHATNRPDLIPPYANLAAAQKDFDFYRQLLTFINLATELLEMMSDTQMAAGSEVMVFCRQFYLSVKMAAQANVPGTTGIYEDLNAFFDLPDRPEDDTEEPEPPTE